MKIKIRKPKCLEYNNVFIFWLVIFSCSAQNHESANQTKESLTDNFISFGLEIDENEAINADEMYEKYQKMIPSDTLQIKYRATVTEVCKNKGCWMKLALKEGCEVMVRFKDYSFFIPKDSKGKEVIISGLAFVKEMSIKNQKHYAKDNRVSEEIINTINSPKKTYSFEANGVLIKQ